MKLFTQTEYDQLIENGKPENHGKNHNPVVKLFVTGTGASFVLTEIRSEKPLMVYGLCNLASDFCKLSHLDLDKIIDLATQSGSEVKRVDKFNAKSPISVFVDAAKRRQTVALMKNFINQQAEIRVR